MWLTDNNLEMVGEGEGWGLEVGEMIVVVLHNFLIEASGNICCVPHYQSKPQPPISSFLRESLNHFYPWVVPEPSLSLCRNLMVEDKILCVSFRWFMNWFFAALAQTEHDYMFVCVSVCVCKEGIVNQTVNLQFSYAAVGIMHWLLKCVWKNAEIVWGCRVSPQPHDLYKEAVWFGLWPNTWAVWFLPEECPGTRYLFKMTSLTWCFWLQVSESCLGRLCMWPWP